MMKRYYRSMVAVTALALVAASPAASAKEKLTIASWGGAYQDAQRKAWFEVVEKELGIEIAEDTTSGIADVRLQVASGSPTWDLVEEDSSSCEILEREGKVEPLDSSILEIKGIPDNLKGKAWISNLVYATVLSWNDKTYPGEKPASWTDMWDTKKFPGRRTMYRSPEYTLESALLADGVPMDKLYPLDVDRAFKKLEEIKGDVAIWWSSGAQSAQVLKDGEVDMATIWNGRAQAISKDGAPVSLTYNQQMLLADCWVVPKGAKHKDLAMKAIAIMSRPEVQARIANYIDYGPANALAYDTGVIPEDVAKRLPSYPDNAKKGFVVDPKFWAENLDKLTQRFNLFIQQ